MKLNLALALTLLSTLSLNAASLQAPLGVGDGVPSGSLTSDSGNVMELSEIISAKPTVLVFYRGGWCPFCTKHLAALMDIVPEIEAAGFQLLAISPDRPELLKGKEKLEGLAYTLLSDSAMEVTRQFGIAFEVPEELVQKYKRSYNIDIEADSGQKHHLLPHPSVYIIDTNGMIQFQYVNEDYKVRLEPIAIMEAVHSIVSKG